MGRLGYLIECLVVSRVQKLKGQIDQGCSIVTD